MAHVLHGLVTSSHTNLQSLDSFSDLDDDASSFMTSTLGSQFRHLGHTPVGSHKMDIGKAETGSIELDEDIFGTCAGD